MFLRTFGWSFGVTAAGLVAALAYGGPAALFMVAVLAILEISLSFDNAVVNAKVLERMSAFWQKIFLTIGIAIAVFGMRILFPVGIVAVTTGLWPHEAINLAMNDHHQYKEIMHGAYPMIASFGGAFLLMIFLDFVFEDRAKKWLPWLERPLARIGKLDQLSVVIAGSTLVIIAGLFATNNGTIMIAGILGLVTYILVNGLGELFAEAHEEEAKDSEHGSFDLVAATGKAGFFLFLYLEVLDASFSFDGVIGAFAVTTDPILIAIGLGAGAMFVRSMTVFLVRKGTLNDYVFLEHGAHWAIGALAVCLLVGTFHEVPEVVSGLTGVLIIGASFVTSVIYNRRTPAKSDEISESPEPALVK